MWVGYTNIDFDTIDYNKAQFNFKELYTAMRVNIEYSMIFRTHQLKYLIIEEVDDASN